MRKLFGLLVVQFRVGREPDFPARKGIRGGTLDILGERKKLPVIVFPDHVRRDQKARPRNGAGQAEQPAAVGKVPRLMQKPVTVSRRDPVFAEIFSIAVGSDHTVPAVVRAVHLRDEIGP